MPIHDPEQAELDRKAEKRVHDDAYRAAHPEDYGLHPLFATILANHARVPLNRTAEFLEQVERDAQAGRFA